MSFRGPGGMFWSQIGSGHIFITFALVVSAGGRYIGRVDEGKCLDSTVQLLRIFTMSLEEVTEANTAAMVELTAELKAFRKSGATPTLAGETAGTPARRPPGRPPAKKGPSIAEVKAIADRVKDEIGRSEAVALIAKHGAAKIADLDEGKYAAFVAAAEVLLEANTGGGEEATDEL